MRAVTISLAGPPGVGKSHFALGMTPKITVFDYDGGVQDILGKFKDKDISIVDCRLPIQWKTRKKTYGKAEWTKFLEDYKVALVDSATVVVDTGTTLWTVIRAAYSEEVGKELMPVMYAVPNARMQAVIQMAREAAVNLVLIQHIRDVYVNDNPTGEKVPDGFSHTDDLVDWALRLRLIVRKGGENTTEFYVAKCRFDRSLVGQTFEDLDYEMLSMLAGG